MRRREEGIGAGGEGGEKGGTRGESLPFVLGLPFPLCVCVMCVCVCERERGGEGGVVWFVHMPVLAQLNEEKAHSLCAMCVCVSMGSGVQVRESLRREEAQLCVCIVACV